MAVVHLLTQLKGVLKQDSISIDSWIPKLHYRFTSTLFLSACFLVSSYQYFGTPVECIQDISGEDAAIPENVINTYCFIQSTYTSVTTGHFGPGTKDSNDSVIHSYYQWTPLVLFLSALAVLLPHYLWSYCDNGLMSACLINIRKSLDVHEYINHIDMLARYLSQRFHSFGGWAIANYFQDVLNTINIVMIFLISDYFLGRSFFNYGLEVLEYLMNGNYTPAGNAPSQEEISPLDRLFPKMTKCEFSKYGPSGSMQRHDALCLMAINIINEKVFLGIWYWLLGMTVFSLVALVLRSLKLIALTLRRKCSLLRKLSSIYKNTEESNFLMAHLNIGDIIFLEQLKENLNDSLFDSLIASICSNLTGIPRENFSDEEEV